MATELEQKHNLTPVELGIFLFSACVSSQLMLGIRSFVTATGHGAWLTLLAGGMLFCGITLLIWSLCGQFPGQSFVEFAPRVWGKRAGYLGIAWFVGLWGLEFCMILSQFSKAIVLTMFDQTPYEAVALAFMAGLVYCALQDLAVISRLQQILLFTAVTAFVLLWLVSLLNIQLINLLPLWPQDWRSLAAGLGGAWQMYGGYEVLLVIAPIVGRSKIRSVWAICASFGCMCLLFEAIVVIVIGVMTVKEAAKLTYPLLSVMRSVEIPGTFVERLELYLIVCWIPLVYQSMSVFLYVLSEIGRRLCGHRDHRPWVLALAPLLYLGCVLMDSGTSVRIAGKIATGLGLGFSLIWLPATWGLAWWRIRRSSVGGRGGPCV